MPLRESKAFVLRTYPLSDTDKICLLLTTDFGKVRVVAKGARRVRSRFGSMLEPLTEIQVSFFEKEHRELSTLSRCEMVQSNYDWGTSPEGEATAHYMAELVDQFSPAAEASQRVYRLLQATTACLRESTNYAAILTYFETWLLKLSGFLPALDHCSNCNTGFEDQELIGILVQGASLCRQCGAGGQGIALASQVRREILGALRLSPREWLATNPGPATIKNFRALLQELIRHVLERELKAQRFANFH